MLHSLSGDDTTVHHLVIYHEQNRRDLLFSHTHSHSLIPCLLKLGHVSAFTKFNHF